MHARSLALAHTHTHNVECLFYVGISVKIPIRIILDWFQFMIIREILHKLLPQSDFWTTLMTRHVIVWTLSHAHILITILKHTFPADTGISTLLNTWRDKHRVRLETVHLPVRFLQCRDSSNTGLQNTPKYNRVTDKIESLWWRYPVQVCFRRSFTCNDTLTFVTQSCDLWTSTLHHIAQSGTTPDRVQINSHFKQALFIVQIKIKQQKKY